MLSHCELGRRPGATHLFEEPGALERVTELAAGWFRRHLAAPDSTFEPKTRRACATTNPVSATRSANTFASCSSSVAFMVSYGREVNPRRSISDPTYPGARCIAVIEADGALDPSRFDGISHGDGVSGREPTGFSIPTCFPAIAMRTAISRSRKFGAVMLTASTRGLSTSSRQSRVAVAKRARRPGDHRLRGWSSGGAGPCGWPDAWPWP